MHCPVRPALVSFPLAAGRMIRVASQSHLSLPRGAAPPLVTYFLRAKANSALLPRHQKTTGYGY